MPSLARIAVISLTALMGSVMVFFAGAFAHKKCVYPFCQGFVNGGTNAPSAFERIRGDVGSRLEKDWKTMRTHLYDVTVDRILLDDPEPRGLIDTLGMDLLVASNDGSLYRVTPDGHQVGLPLAIPASPEPSLEDSPEEDTRQEQSVPVSWFGVKDILVTPAEPKGAVNLFAAYHHWNADRGCAILRLSHSVLHPDAESASGLQVRDAWRTLHDTEPCISPAEVDETGDGVATPYAFSGYMYGARIVPGPDGTTVLLSGGDPDVDRYCDEPGQPCSYTRILEIDYVSGTSSVYSRGHRNPQGLHVDAEGRVWSTEHARRGGDELNWIRKGEHYGWPYVSYSTDYGSLVYQRMEAEGGVTGTHDGYTRPVYAWVPGGIGISQLTSVSTGSAFRKWNGDLIVGSLSGQSLFRVRIRENRAVLVERILMNARIRDVAERPDGTIALRTDSPYVYLLRPVNAKASEDGEALALRSN